MPADRHEPTGRIDSISIASNAVKKTSIIVVKKPITFTGRVLHAVHKFIFVADKHLEEGYSPKYRYLPIVSAVVVPVRLSSTGVHLDRVQCFNSDI